jgi:quercetin dioxygenase-like cupin family protein
MPTPTTNPSNESIHIGPLLIRFLLSSPDTNSAASVFELTVPAGQKVPAPPHINDAYEEILYGIEGTLTWMVGGIPTPIGPGQALCIPRGTTHWFVNQSDRPAKQLVIITPPIMGPAYFREAAAAINAANAAGGGGAPPDRAKMAALLKRHGMTVVPA